jgi:hypothetical protein
VIERNSKRESVISGRLNEEESARWARLMDMVKARNPLADVSKVLRDVLFGSVGIVDENDRALLKMPIMPTPEDTTALSEGQKHLFSTGEDKPRTKRESRAIRKDIADIKKDARERTRKKQQKGD